MQHSYSKESLYRIAKENYQIIRGYCELVSVEGYWDGPEDVLGVPILEMLDQYVQTLLLQLARHCNHLSYEEKRFISMIPGCNILQIKEDQELTDDMNKTVVQIFKAPPILIQVLGLRDVEKNSGLTGLFFDALLNILLCMAHLNISGLAEVTKFIKQYFYKVEVFLYNHGKYSCIVDERYLFLKLCNGDLEHSSKWLEDAGESFQRFCRKHFYRAVSVKEECIPPVKYIESKGFEEESEWNPDEKYFVLQNIDLEEETIDDKEYIDSEYNHDTLIEEVEANQTECSEFQKEEVEVTEDFKNKLDDLLEDLNALVGLSGVKEEIKSLINLIKVARMRIQHNLPTLEMSYHMVFTGSPGTGKTTVARLIAAIYKELGILSKGALVETDRAGLVAGYVGQTALKVKEVVERAIGGVLFIDEAYSLSSGNLASNDFGEEAIDTLVKMMEDHRDDLIVIVAGYTAEMQRFLKANTGLVSRFNKYIEFANYKDEELMLILESMANKSGFCLEESAKEAVRNILECMVEEKRKEFGNARGIRNLFEKLVGAQANRIILIEKPTIEQLTTITAEDVLLRS